MTIVRTIILISLLVTMPLTGLGGNVKDSARIVNRQIDALLSKLHETSDSTVYYSLLPVAIQKAMECDKYDTLPNKKGRVEPRYRAQNQQRIAPLRTQLLQKGLDRGHEPPHLNTRYIDIYLHSATHSLFRDHTRSVGDVSLEASRIAFYGEKDYQTAGQYADIALTDERWAEQAADIKIHCMQQQLRNHTDSLKYLTALRALHHQSPQHEDYFYMLMDYFSQPGHEKELENFARDEIKADSTNIRAWTILGELSMNYHDWDDAIASYSRVLAVDSTLAVVWYNVGICYSSQGQQLKDDLTDSRGRLTKSNRVRVRRIYDMARRHLVKASELDPERKRVDWATPLYQAYYILGEKDKANKLKQDIME